LLARAAAVGALGVGVTGASVGRSTAAPESTATDAAPSPAVEAAGEYRAHGRNIRQSVAHWCFNLNEKTRANPKHGPMPVAELIAHAKRMGLSSVELLGPEHFKALKDAGLVCAMASSGTRGGFVRGLNNPAHHEHIVERTTAAINACAEHGFPNVIAFNGFKYRNPDDPSSGEIPRDEGAAHCVEGLKKLAGHAEKRKVAVCLEMLNSRDASHPMKGHPGYQGDDLDYCADIVRKVGSPYVKLLFDIYHVQIMNGDVIRRIRQHHEIIGHYHTAGNPGRHELDERNEINYPAVMKAIADTRYQGHVGQEFIPTWDDKIASLAHAVKLCDI
jgi:hydroxypyruvate isomerase